MTLKIAGGSVTYGETRKIADYESKTASATLTFGAPDNGEVSHDEIAKVHAHAKHHVHVALGIPSAAPDTDKAKLEAEKKKPATKTVEKSADPLALTPAPKAEPAPEQTIQIAATPSDAAALFTGAAKEIVDDDLYSAIMAKNKAHENTLTDKIRETIGKYAGAGMAANMIPKDKREGFLLELNALK